MSICNNLAVSFSLIHSHKEACRLYDAILENEQIDETIYNKALATIEHGSIDVHTLIDQLHTSPFYMSSIDNIDLSRLYYLTGDYESSYLSLMENCNFSLLDWEPLGFVLFNSNKIKFEELKHEAIQQREIWKNDYIDDCESQDSDNFLDTINSLNSEIFKLEKLEYRLDLAPKVETQELYHILPLGCMLYDCEVCDNPFDD